MAYMPLFFPPSVIYCFKHKEEIMQSIAERSQVLELVQSLSDEQVRYVLNVIQSLPQRDAAPRKCTLRGRFASYANPELRAREKEAWALAAEEKHGLR